MPSSQFDLTVDSLEPTAVVEITDDRYQLLSQQTRRTTISVPPGLYLARVKYNDRVEERIVKHGSKDSFVVFGPEDSNDAAAPSTKRTAVALAEHFQSIQNLNLRTWVTVAIKAPGLSDLPANLAMKIPSWTEFSVLHLDGRSLPAHGVFPTTWTDSERILGQGLDVGWYCVQIPARDGSCVRLPLYVSPAFSPTVLLEVGGVTEKGQAWFDFDRLVVSYDALEGGAYGDPQRLAALRAARRSLELGRNGMTESLMRVFYDQKFQDPMLGLLALQLLLLNAKAAKSERLPELEKQFNVVADNMARALDLPNHPDLVIARAQARRHRWEVPAATGDDEPLVAPPLLKASWNQMMSMPDRRREASVAGGRLRSVGRGLLQSGIWVMWKPVPADDTLEEIVELRPGRAKRSEPRAYSETQQIVHATKIAPRPPSQSEQRAYSAGPQFEYEAQTLSRRRPSRSVDAALEEIVDQVRATPVVGQSVRRRLAAYEGTVLDRNVARAVLQLAEIETDDEQNVPRGFSQRMATNLSLPFPLIRDTVFKLKTQLLEEASVENQVEPPTL